MEESAIAEEDPVWDTNTDCHCPEKFCRSILKSSCLGHPAMDSVNYDNIQLSGIGKSSAERKITLRGPCILPAPRSQQSIKTRSSLPPLQQISITKRCLEEWPEAGFDDVGEWLCSATPGGKRDARMLLNGGDIRLDLGSVDRKVEPEVKRNNSAIVDEECSRIAENIYLGSDVVAKNREVLCQNGITHVLNCVGYHCSEYFKTDFIYKTLWLLDSPSEDITSILYDVFDYFEEVREQGGRILVHCCHGVSRSTSLVIAYLMWRKSQSFEDAFQFVKAARGITDPNIGFSYQLLQWQKKLDSAPMCPPRSLLGMYRMAPHASHAPLHLVPKSVSTPGLNALDSRGAFIVQMPSATSVWIGNGCNPVMEKMAKASASQIVRYEGAQSPIVIIKEGHENVEFLYALSKAHHLPDDHDKAESNASENIMLEGFFCSNGEIDAASRVDVGNKRVESYNIDFEVFERAMQGVVPQFSF